MTLPDITSMRYGPGDYADPVEVTRIVRFLNNATSQAVGNSLVVKGSAGLCFGFTASSSLGSAQFIQLFDATVLPADGTVPTLVLPVATTSVVTIAYVPPRGFRNGIVICNSTTQNTKTIGAANTLFDVQFI